MRTAGGYVPRDAATYGLHQFGAAHARSRARRTQGKLVIEP